MGHKAPRELVSVFSLLCWKMLMRVQDGVHHDREHHDLHDSLGLRDWRHLRHRCQLSVHSSPECGLDTWMLTMPRARCVLRGTELAKAEYPCPAYGRDCHVDRTETRCTPRVHPRGLEADDDREAAR